ncbi:MAG: cytochrome c3 family protein [Polyangiaceae bacterium]
MRARHSAVHPAWLALLLFVAALAAACGERSAPRFPHALHLAGLACGGAGQPACLRCNSCHALSESRAGRDTPSVERCALCHHANRDLPAAVIAAAPERPYGAIAFNHDRHLALPSVGGQCVGCHSGVVQVRAPALPPMSQCFGCHEHEEQWRAGQCAPCHAAGDLKRLMPQTFLRHEGGFMRHHGIEAVQQKRLCQACHAQADCDSCHDVSQDLSVERRRPEAIQRSFVHRGDFMTTHPLEARSQPTRCLRCHTTESCDACHTLRGLSGSLINGRNPHPLGWVGGTANARSLHGSAARRDILACASCHDQGPSTNCIRCHKVGAYGGNPHPAGWKSTRSESSQMCRYCHE